MLRNIDIAVCNMARTSQFLRTAWLSMVKNLDRQFVKSRHAELAIVIRPSGTRRPFLDRLPQCTHSRGKIHLPTTPHRCQQRRRDVFRCQRTRQRDCNLKQPSHLPKLCHLSSDSKEATGALSKWSSSRTAVLYHQCYDLPKWGAPVETWLRYCWWHRDY